MLTEADVATVAQLVVQGFAENSYLHEIESFIPETLIGDVDDEDLINIQSHIRASKIILRQGR